LTQMYHNSKRTAGTSSELRPPHVPMASKAMEA